MAQLFNMEIAGVNFILNGDESLRLHDTDPAYHPFIHGGLHVAPAAGIEISLKSREKMPKTIDLDRIFHSGDAWSMFRDDEGYCISLDLPGYDEPIWMARVTRDFSTATILCSRELVIRSNGNICLSNPITYPLDQILLMYILAKRKGFLVHAMGLISKNRGYLFPGRSGAGKSTMALQLDQKKDFEILSDDRLVVRDSGDLFKMFGTPWPGDAGISLNRSVDLSAIFFLEHGQINRIEPIGKQETVERLLSVISVPWYDNDMVPPILATCEELVKEVPSYTLQFKPGIEAADLLHRFIEELHAS